MALVAPFVALEQPETDGTYEQDALLTAQVKAGEANPQPLPAMAPFCSVIIGSFAVSPIEVEL